MDDWDDEQYDTSQMKGIDVKYGNNMKWIEIDGKTVPVECIGVDHSVLTDFTKSVWLDKNGVQVNFSGSTEKAQTMPRPQDLHWDVMLRELGLLDAFRCIESVTGTLEPTMGLAVAQYVFEKFIIDYQIRKCCERNDRATGKV